MHLRLEVSEEIHKESFSKFDLFQKVGSKKFLAFVSSRFKQQLFTDSMYFYQRGDVVDNFYFAIRGIGAFVSEMDNEMFALVDPDEQQASHNKEKKNKKMKVQQPTAL